MNNWWQSIRDRAAQIKGYDADWVHDAILISIVLFIGISAFGLGRISTSQEGRAAVRLLQQTTFSEAPMRIGGMIVASRNGSKDHFAGCSGAKRMNEVNKIWFESIEMAVAAGYLPASNCKGLK